MHRSHSIQNKSRSYKTKNNIKVEIQTFVNFDYNETIGFGNSFRYKKYEILKHVFSKKHENYFLNIVNEV